MKILVWNALSETERAAALARPAQSRAPEVVADVVRILEQVRCDGDAALRALTRRFDGAELDRFGVDRQEFDVAEAALGAELKLAIAQALQRIERFHEATVPRTLRVETAPGVVCERVLRPINRVGLYVPAGKAPLPSTALMLGVPARMAQCPDVALCTPPGADGRCDATVLYVARLCGIEHVFKLGGAQAIAAMAFGTESVPRCDKVFGPGNAWVSEAKRQVAQMRDGAAIDLPAGASEVLVIADREADPVFLAADLLAQAEHGPDSQVLLLADDRAVIEATALELRAQLTGLPRAAIAGTALEHSRLILVADLDAAMAVSNRYAPEHLILNVHDPRRWLQRVENAGSVFLGPWSPETVGDYCSGTNHVLPTDGHARSWSGLSVASFLKMITVQELTSAGLVAIGPCAATLARAEGLQAHARAVTLRLQKVDNAA